jgi:D-3-phosphoglycerate dehydrogenase
MTMTSPTVIVGAGTSYLDIETERAVLAETGADIIDARALTDQEVRHLATTADALITDYFACDAELIETMSRCRVLASYGVGFDQIDVSAADAAGIVVTNNPAYCVDEVAEHTIALILASLRRVVPYDRHVRRGGWDYTSQPAPRRIQGTTVAVIGYGKIGRAVGALARSAGFSVVVHDPFLPDGLEEAVGLDEALAAADVVSLHLPLSPQTRGIIGSRELAMLRPTAGLVNTARGGILDHDALAAALQEKRLAWAALDALDPEPPEPDHPLLHLDQVTVTPHAAFYSNEALQAAQCNAALEVRRILTGQSPASAVGRHRSPIGR